MISGGVGDTKRTQRGHKGDTKAAAAFTWCDAYHRVRGRDVTGIVVRGGHIRTVV